MMEIVDMVLSITSAFFIIILFNSISYQVINADKKLNDYILASKISDNVFSSLFSPGYPEYWEDSPEDAAFIGLMKENYGYEIDNYKLISMQSLCSTNESLFKKKVLAEGGYSVYVLIKDQLSNSQYEICNKPTSYSKLFRKTAYAEHLGDVAKVEVMLWK